MDCAAPTGAQSHPDDSANMKGPQQLGALPLLGVPGRSAPAAVAAVLFVVVEMSSADQHWLLQEYPHKATHSC